MNDEKNRTSNLISTDPIDSKEVKYHLGIIKEHLDYLLAREFKEVGVQPLIDEGKERPTVVCLCGSTRFWKEFQQAGLRETLAGKIVLSIGAASGTDDEHFGNLSQEEYDRVKAMLDELHKRKIDLADEILILNVGGYLGDSTLGELLYARRHNIRVRWLEPDLSGRIQIGDTIEDRSAKEPRGTAK